MDFRRQVLIFSGILFVCVRHGYSEVTSKTHLPVNVEQRSALVDNPLTDNEIPAGINGPTTFPMKTTDGTLLPNTSPVFNPKNSNLHDIDPSSPTTFKPNSASTTSMLTSTTQTWNPWNTSTPTVAPYLINAFPVLNSNPYLPHQQVVTSLFPFASVAGNVSPGTPVINIWNVQMSPPFVPPPIAIERPVALANEPVNIIPGTPLHKPVFLPPRISHPFPVQEAMSSFVPEYPSTSVKSASHCVLDSVVINYGVEKNDWYKSPADKCPPQMELNVGNDILAPVRQIEGPAHPLHLTKHFGTVITDNVLRHAGIRSIEVSEAHGNIINGHRLGWSDRFYKTGVSIVLSEMGPKVIAVTVNGEQDTFEIGNNGEPRLASTITFQPQNVPSNPLPPFEPQHGRMTVPSPQTQPYPQSRPPQSQNAPVQPPTPAPENSSIVEKLILEEPKSSPTITTGEKNNGTEIQFETSKNKDFSLTNNTPKVAESIEKSNTTETKPRDTQKIHYLQVENMDPKTNDYPQVPIDQPPYLVQSQPPQYFQPPQYHHQQPQQRFAGNGAPMTVNPNEGPVPSNDRSGMMFSAGVPVNYNGPPPPSYGFVGPNGQPAHDFVYNNGAPVVHSAVAWTGAVQVNPASQLNFGPNNMEGPNGPSFEARKSFVEGPRGVPMFVRQ